MAGVPDVATGGPHRPASGEYRVAGTGAADVHCLGDLDEAESALEELSSLLLLRGRELVVAQRHIRLTDEPVDSGPMDPESRGNLSDRGS